MAADLHGALSTAIENKKRDSLSVLTDLTAPMVHLKDAARVLDRAATTYADVCQRPGFDVVAFDAAVREYERAAAGFAAIVPAPPGHAEDTGEQGTDA